MMVDLRDMCGTVSLAAHFTARRLRWFGHVVHMDEGRISQVALYSTLQELQSGLETGHL
jgi:hypothetical protein